MSNNTNNDKTNDIKPERVGILLVHGIGETKKFENIEATARAIATSLQADGEKDRKRSVRVFINTSDDMAYKANQQVWLADEKGPLMIEVTEYESPEKKKIIKITQLCFQEVWWADLGKTSTLQSQLSFWKWGLSLWSRSRYLAKWDERNLSEGETKENMGVLTEMILPKYTDTKTRELELGNRIKFFVVSWVILLVLPLLSLLSVILRQVLGFNNIRPDILVQYLGDIKRYQQKKREGGGYLIDLGQPPRITVRRRMIEGLVKMRLANYDRWYVLSHSLGTVVAFNGLMEPDATLPNYLSQDLWEEVKNSNIKTMADLKEKPLTEKEKLLEEKVSNMFPARPIWLTEEGELDKDQELYAMISRKDLFKNLKGFMTYGSPLSKFAVVWPAIVPINRDNSIFSEDFQWVNVYDPTDPVADKTKYFFSKDSQQVNLEDPQKAYLPLTEIAYKAESIHLLSHIKYLTYNPKRKNPLVKQVAYWLLEGGDFPQLPEPKNSWGWPREKTIHIHLYRAIRYALWPICGVGISWGLSFLIPENLPDTIKEMLNDTMYLALSNFLFYCLGAAVIVFLFGIVVRLTFEIETRKQRKKKQNLSGNHPINHN